MGFLDLIFGASKPKYPRVTNDMVQPVDSTISTTDAKRIIKEFYRAIGYCSDASEARFEAESLADSIRYHEENLRDVLEMLKDEYERDLAEWKDELASLKEELADSDPDDKEAAREEITLHNQSKPSDKEYRAAKEALAAFKADKRSFLIQYINEQLHGSDEA